MYASGMYIGRHMTVCTCMGAGMSVLSHYITYAWAYMFVCMYINTHITNMFHSVCVCKNEYMYAYMCVGRHLYMYECTYCIISMYAYINMYTYI